jgi:polygalacturonase
MRIYLNKMKPVSKTNEFRRPVFLIRSALGCLALAVVFGCGRALAVVPWTLLVNTNNVIVVTNAPYGAVGNGVFTNTAAIQSAINAASAGGNVGGLYGGTVRIPGPGIYMCGPLNMSNYVNLQVDAGAILRMLPIDQYPGGTTSPANFINASHLHDLAISGPGAIDGQGAPWWLALEANSAIQRPRMINFSSCDHKLIQNITLSNAPMFNLALGGNNTTVQGVIIRAPSSSHNTDACDVNGTNILVQNCDISVGDDDFTCSGGTWDVLITNNVYGTGHGVSIGSYTSGGVSNITVINCSFNGTDNGIRLKSMRGRGGLVQNLNYLNLNMTNVAWPLLVYSYYEYGLGTLTGVDPTFAATTAITNATTLNSTTPIWRNITFSNITATMPAGRPPLMVWGLPEAPASHIVFRSVHITSASTLDPGVYNATNIQFVDCSFKLPAGVKTMQFWNAGLIFTNSPGSSTATNLWLLDGLTTNGIGNSLQFYNAPGSLANTNALDDGPLTLSASTFTVSNNLSLTPNNVVDFYLGTNGTTLAVAGNLALGGTNHIFAGAGFTNGTYTLMTYAGTLSGAVPTLGTVPAGYNYGFDTNTAGQVKLVVSPLFTPPPDAPANLAAIAGDGTVGLTWSPSATATNYFVKRAVASGGPYTTNAVGAVTSYSDTDVTNGVTYYYLVSAVNAGGEGADSSEVSATPQVQTYIVVTTNILSDTFENSDLNSLTPSAPTSTNTSYDLASSKSWNPAPSLSSGHLKFGIGTTTSGSIEAQALFAASPVTLATVGDSVSLVVTFTNTSGLLTQAGAMGFGLYNSGQNYPVPGGLNGTATTSSTDHNSGNAQPWVGYVGQLGFTGSSSRIMTRPAQTFVTLSNNCQDVVTSGSGSSSYNYPSGDTVGLASTSPSLTLVAGNPYTEVLTITLTAADTLAITNTLYDGTDTNSALLSQLGGVASGSTFLANSFDSLAIGWRTTASTSATTIDINQIAVNATLTVATTNNPTPPAAPANLQASPTNLLINLKWDAVAGATNYNLMRGTVSGVYPTVFSGLTATNYADSAVTNAVNYFYVVTAAGEGGESTNSLEVSAVPLPSNQPTNITAQVVGNQLQLSWPQDHLGWLLEIQTNDLSAGLNTNWVAVPNSTNVMATNIVINPANGSVFLRLVYP